jgi:hypothetical protein
MKATKTAVALLAFVPAALAQDKLKAIDPFSGSPETHRIIQNDDGPAYTSKPPERTLKERFHEPLLNAEAETIPESYRFTYFPTFENPWTIRLIVRSENSGDLIVKRLSGKGGYDPGKLDLTRTLPITGERFNKLIEILRKPDAARPYGNLTELQVGMLAGLDGSTWHLETRRGQGYRCADVWCANDLKGTKKIMLEEKLTVYKQLNPQPFLQACEALIRAAALKLDSQLGKLEDKQTANKSEQGNR